MTTNRDPREIVREETLMRREVLAVLADGPHTVPEIAEALGRPAHEAMTWVMGMRRYGWVREAPGGAADGYFKYQAVDREKR
jgi:predicted Rossmann fold nucleotide-binding protein DprA/Smf involved in DNA uptake